jgi:hypothetical protein
MKFTNNNNANDMDLHSFSSLTKSQSKYCAAMEEKKDLGKFKLCGAYQM